MPRFSQIFHSPQESDVVLSWNGAAAGQDGGGDAHSTHPPQSTPLPHRVCDYVVENATVGPDTEDQHDHNDGDELVSRVKRQSTELYMDLRQTRCPLLLVADYRY